MLFRVMLFRIMLFKVMLFGRIIKVAGALCACVLFTACVVSGPTDQRVLVSEPHLGSQLDNKPLGRYMCPEAAHYESQVVGNGHCVSLIQLCSGAPLTRHWREGPSVRGASIKAGAVIATFENERYPNKAGWHAAIYISQDEQGIWVWDQWVGKPVHKRLIRFRNGRGTANNDGDAYSIVN